MFNYKKLSWLKETVCASYQKNRLEKKIPIGFDIFCTTKKGINFQKITNFSINK